MNSRIYEVVIRHSRLEPVSHSFSYPAYTFAFDLDELPQLDRDVRGFGYNRFNLYSLRDGDYLRGDGPLKEQLLRFLAAHGSGADIARVELLTMARYFNYVFNPVSFYYAYRPDGGIQCIVAEVNNTFNERHLYLLRDPLNDPASPVLRFRHNKEFHVSPFNDMAGWYEFSFSRLGEDLDIRIDLWRGERKVITTQMTGAARPLNSANLRRTMFRHPLAAALNMPRIVTQAARLYYGKKMAVFHKPNPRSALTIPAPPTRFERLALRAIRGFLSRLRRGRLTLRLPDGEALAFGGAEPGIESAMQLRNYALFPRILKDGDVGFGESYVAGDWVCDDLTALFRLFINNADTLDDRRIKFSWIGRSLNRLRHELRRNTYFGSRRNIAAHYDLGNDLYRLFLDESMLYSCAIFARPDDSLEQAQQNKLQTLIRKARIGPDDHVLEIGCGWGAFAIAAARTTGCRVTGITLSQQQLEWARARVREAGLADRIRIELCDYRAVAGQFDKIVSIEMLEAVGHEFLGAFFAACDRVLAPDGLAVMQVITIPDQRYDAYRRSTDWIQKHIFPGGVTPSLSALTQAMTRESRFVIESLENIGPHYAPTLREWRRRFAAHREDLLKLGYDEVFQRKFHYYFCYCEAGFATRTLNDLHLVLTRPGNKRLDPPDS